MLSNTCFKIKAIDEFDFESEENLYWSNTFGWVKYSDADSFSSEEMIEFYLPIGGVWEKIIH